jgi:hypothetical protein
MTITTSDRFSEQLRRVESLRARSAERGGLGVGLHRTSISSAISKYLAHNKTRGRQTIKTMYVVTFNKAMKNCKLKLRRAVPRRGSSSAFHPFMHIDTEIDRILGKVDLNFQ